MDNTKPIDDANWRPIETLPADQEFALFKMDNGHIVEAENFPHHGGWHYANCMPWEFENAKRVAWQPIDDPYQPTKSP